MIVVISDLHLQHTALDGIRWEAEGEVYESTIRRNVGGEALSLLLAETIDNVERTGAKEVHLVFAGDIFELHRTPLWLLGGSVLRPTLHPASASAKLEKQVHAILDAIGAENRGFFAVLARFVEERKLERRGNEHSLDPAVALHVHYVPGNHDRLVGAWPSARARVRGLLKVAAPGGEAGAPFPHVLEWREAYGTIVRHGHEYDPFNFADAFEPASPPDDAVYDQPALGDFVTVDVATRLAVAFRAHYARELRRPDDAGARLRRIYDALTEFDDVRPQTMLFEYLTDAIGASDQETFALLRPVLRDAYETARADAFFVSEAKRIGLGKYFDGPLSKLIEAALENLSGEHVRQIISAMQRFRGQSGAQGPAAYAQRERGITSGDLSVVVAGHTHEPAHVSLKGPEGMTSSAHHAYFLDSGTWRTRVDAGASGTFGRLRSYTMIFCYSDAESSAVGHRRFETWTGHLRAEDYGPSVRKVTPSERRPRAKVRFISCRVQHVDEGETHDGAELVVTVGVDGVGQSYAFEGVHDGDERSFPDGAIVEVDPALDGEVWCFGLEQDLGDSILDRDDPMPWATAFLPRSGAGDNQPFASGTVELRAADNRGNAYVVSAAVSEA